MGFEATLSYNLPRIDTLSHGGLRTFLVKLYNFALSSDSKTEHFCSNTEFTGVSLPIGGEVISRLHQK